MSFIEDLYELKKLADYIYEEGQKIAKKYEHSDTPRNHIEDTIRRWIKDGKLVLRSSQGTRSEVLAKIKEGILYPTPYAPLMMTDKAMREQFESYIACGRVMDYNNVAVRKGYYTQYSIDKAVRNGELGKIDDFDNAIILYTD